MSKIAQRMCRRVCPLGAAILMLAACASTTLTNSWRDPAYTGPSLKKVMVMGVSTQSSVRRVFEDEFVSELRAAGVAAIASYTLIAQDGKADEATLQQAVRESGASGALISRLVRRETKTQVTPAMYPPVPAFGFYGGTRRRGSDTTSRRPSISTTSLRDIDAQRLLWAGTTETFSPSNVRKDTKELAKLIIDALKQQRLI